MTFLIDSQNRCLRQRFSRPSGVGGIKIHNHKSSDTQATFGQANKMFGRMKKMFGWTNKMFGRTNGQTNRRTDIHVLSVLHKNHLPIAQF